MSDLPIARPRHRASTAFALTCLAIAASAQAADPPMSSLSPVPAAQPSGVLARQSRIPPGYRMSSLDGSIVPIPVPALNASSEGMSSLGPNQPSAPRAITPTEIGRTNKVFNSLGVEVPAAPQR